MKQVSHYSLSSVRSSLIHFATGKAFSAISAISVLFIVSRAIPKEDYAVLAIFQAIVLFSGVISSFGVSQSIARFVPELRSLHNNATLYRLVFFGTISRVSIYSLVLFCVYLAATQFAKETSYGEAIDLLPFYLVIGLLRLVSYFIASVMESLLWQKQYQYVLAYVALQKLAIVVFVYSVLNNLNLINFLYIEFATELTGLILLYFSFIRGWLKDKHKDSGDIAWLKENSKRVFDYGLSGYFRTLTSILYGSDPNRLVAANYLPREYMADYGFANSITSIIKRFLPANILLGMIRPIFISRYTINNNISELNAMANLVFRFSLVVLSPVILILLTSGYTILNWITDGKYGETAYLIAGITAVLVLESLRSQLELTCITLEKNGIIIKANLILSASIFLSIPLFPIVGAWAVVISNAIGNIIAVIFIHKLLQSSCYKMTLDTNLVLRIIIALATSISISNFTIISVDSYIRTIISLIIFTTIIYFWIPFTESEKHLFKRLIKKPRLP